MNKLEETISPVTVPATWDFAKSIFTKGTDAFGGRELLEAGLTSENTLPPIPFSEDELRRARELGQYLIFQVDQAAGSRRLTMRYLHDQFANILEGGKLFFDIDWYHVEPSFTQDTPRAGWALVSREVIPGSAGVDYIGQTQVIVDYLVGQVYKDQELPAEYAAAVEEFVSRKRELERLIQKDWTGGARALGALKLNQWFREKPVEVVYGLIVQKKINHVYLLGDMYTWTSVRSSNGGLVCVGRAGSDGVDVLYDFPRGSRSLLGVRFFRRASLES